MKNGLSVDTILFSHVRSYCRAYARVHNDYKSHDYCLESNLPLTPANALSPLIFFWIGDSVCKLLLHSAMLKRWSMPATSKATSSQGHKNTVLGILETGAGKWSGSPGHLGIDSDQVDTSLAPSTLPLMAGFLSWDCQSWTIGKADNNIRSTGSSGWRQQNSLLRRVIVRVGPQIASQFVLNRRLRDQLGYSMPDTYCESAC